MDKKEFRKFLRECISEVIIENLGEDPNNPLYVEYLKPMSNEEPFMMNGEKFEYCWAKYPNGKVDIGVYAYRGDVCYGYNAFRKRYNLPESSIQEGRRICAWCKKDLGQADTDLDSHGICPSCKDKMMKDIPQKPQPNKPEVEESGWTVKSSPSTENIGKKYLEDAKNIAYKVWGGVYLTQFHSTSKDGKSVFYEIRLHSAQGDRHWLVRDKDGSWKASVGHGIESKWEPVDKYLNVQPDPSMGDLKQDKLSEMTGTSAVQGFYGKNWVDPDPERKRMKSIAAKSVGGSVA